MLVEPRARLLHGVAVFDAVDGDGHGLKYAFDTFFLFRH
jgi:hypothetical protein